MRNDIYLMFSDYRQSFKLKWGKVINSGFESIINELEAECDKYDCLQEVDKDYIIWRDKNQIIQAMFCFPQDVNDINSILKIFNTIKNNNSLITFIFIEQLSDGEGNYDIFRISEKSYLEHNNRVRYRRK